MNERQTGNANEEKTNDPQFPAVRVEDRRLAIHRPDGSSGEPKPPAIVPRLPCTGAASLHFHRPGFGFHLDFQSSTSKCPTSKGSTSGAGINDSALTPDLTIQGQP
ncbi:uncharacterized protein VDAG_05408 [Verticillium dahliae VdLs.17]|uniref:Uncharacterized protein n=1 Tax=Verticillium dahliae (strain VdLs.17 / ATCC MYA-4575 / FGSC 10137) TaxID=498257 RepID=G2X5A3_VERDV|nr:uncharacterized protein VDAG_05408 [Verticillium dahliae VdLs.17]EGY14244.1 hypothetical protein VDAG_05408 [Verticillium dahliae VdLs.17]KAF3343016.1 hypothetical protein VdG2_09003 [Verticillium dahliae VDG2]KAH6701104.1 hypothetical protein EV126DRAFT_442389 [Verticillium dahliae]